MGCGVLASAICMNKPVANLIFAAHNIPHTPWFAVDRYAIEDFGYLTDKVGEYLQYPIFVKPASGGSSLGITKVTEPAGLRQAMLLASAHDRRILLEQGVDGCEVECAVIGNNNPYATLPGEIVPCNEIYDYEAKYESGDKSALHIPARLPQEKLEEVRELALRAYQATGCTGLARVDFFVEKGTGKVFISEINTMPGFTDISMYPKLMQQLEKHTFSELLHSLVVLAVERAEQ
ncbi:MAG: D-alanine--D-alanine ligase [Oscillospiraceae bacterium]